MWKFLNHVRDYAFDKHKNVNQTYDDLPYSTHLKETADNIIKYFGINITPEDKIILIASSYCHDLIEDTRTTYNDLLCDLSKIKTVTHLSEDYDIDIGKIADIVFDLTNEKGKNRSERENDKYFNAIANNDLAKIVKLSDRLANVEHSMLFYNFDKMFLYYKEHENFINKLNFSTILKNNDSKLKSGVAKMLEVLSYNILTIKTIIINNGKTI